MLTVIKKISLLCSAVFFMAIITVPSILKIHHALFEHTCISHSDSDEPHVYEIENDCDFQKYNNLLPDLYKTATVYIELINPLFNYKITQQTYSFYTNHKQLSFQLRGPPILV